MRRNRRTLILTLLVTFSLMLLLTMYTVSNIYRTSYQNVYEVGSDKTTAITADLEKYLENAKSVLWVTADTVDHMLAEGATHDEIVAYITRESYTTETQFDSTYTGIYGYINGKYADGVGWVPPETYDATDRDWYKAAQAAEGQVIITSPYVESVSGDVIISVCKTLSNSDNVIGLDLALTGVQDLVEDVQINGTGYGVILNNNGMIIANPNKELNGKYYSDYPEFEQAFSSALEIGEGNFTATVEGKECTIFVDQVLDQWTLVIVTETSRLFEAPRSILVVSVIVNLSALAILAGFYILSYQYEIKANKRLDEMKALEQQKDYEAKLLKLEKTAADNANRAKSDFLADMSHEIRTPINAVLGMNEMILNKSDDEQILDYATSIKSAGKTLLSIINNILDFSKIEDGKMNLVPVEFDTTELITGLINSISERAKAKQLDLIVDVDETIPTKLFGDDVRISQVIMNLLTNGVKYTEKGSVTLRVRNQGVIGDDVNLRVDVIDTGIGIKEEDFDKLTKSFERIEEKRNRHIEGTGLGMSIVTKLLNMMNSQLEVESVYGEGSTFGFNLHLRIVDHALIGKFEEKKKSIFKNTEKSERLSAPGIKVLVTDDNEMNLKVASNLLQFFNIYPELCTSGFETIDLCEKNKYDIIFLDHMMPKMDGIECLDILKARKLIDSGTLVIALTANAVVGAKEMFLDAGFDDYLSKPILLDDLENMLRKHIPEAAVENIPVSQNQVAKNDENFEVFEFDPAGDDDGGSDSGLSIEKAIDAGLNVSEGISFAAGDDGFYLEILRDYANDAEIKCAKLDSFLRANDWKNYNILVHSVKSASRTVGADELTEKARMLEEAAGREDADFVRANHEELVSKYRELARQLL